MTQTLTMPRSDTSVVELFAPLSPWLTRDDVTEIAINRPNEVWFEAQNQWQHVEIPLSLEYLESMSVAVAAYTNNNIDVVTPILSAVLPDGARVQFVRPPACEQGTLSLTVRKPSKTIRTLHDYQQEGYFAHIYPVTHQLSPVDAQLVALKERGELQQFFELAVLLEKTIVIAGGTGSGKTTFMKALMTCIPRHQRIITIEDVPELFLPFHPNHVHLFYPSEAQPNDPVTAAKLLKSCLRMKPDRIMLAELRGAETFDFINVTASGHGGSITSCHAGSCAMAFERLAMMAMENPRGQAMPYDVLMRLLHQTIDIVVHVTNDVHSTAQLGRHITEIWFNPQATLS